MDPYFKFKSINSWTCLLFSFNIILSVLLSFLQFGKLPFFISSTIFPSMFCFSTVSILPYLINSSAISSPLLSSSSSSAICHSVTCFIGAKPMRLYSSWWASTLLSLLSTSLLISSNRSCYNQPFF